MICMAKSNLFKSLFVNIIPKKRKKKESKIDKTFTEIYTKLTRLQTEIDELNELVYEIDELVSDLQDYWLNESAK